MKIRTLSVATVALAALLAGCADVVNGTGATAGSAGPTSPSSGFPSAPSSPSPSSGASGLSPGSSTVPTPGPTASAPTPCPHVRFPAAKLSFDCITTGLTADFKGQVWPLSEVRTVEPKTGWVLEEGAGHWGAEGNQSLASIAQSVRQRMVDDGDYGTSPTASTVANRNTTVDGAAARLLQSTMTINPTWARQRGTKVEQEKLWIVAIRVGADDVSLWYTSLPDLAKSLWANVPAVIATIKVG
jgi:hypothetical protein